MQTAMVFGRINSSKAILGVKVLHTNMNAME